MSTRFVAAATGLSLLVSATPAFAMFSFEDDADISIHASENGKMHSKAKLMMERHGDDDDDNDDRTGSGDDLMKHGRSEMMKLEVTAEQKASMLERMEKRTVSVVKRAVNLLAKFAKRTCGATEDTDADIATCVATVKSNIKAQFNIMIDAAFGA